MYKDLEPELNVQADEVVEEYPVEATEIDAVPPLVERLHSWLEIIDR